MCLKLVKVALKMQPVGGALTPVSLDECEACVRKDVRLNKTRLQFGCVAPWGDQLEELCASAFLRVLVFSLTSELLRGTM